MHHKAVLNTGSTLLCKSPGKNPNFSPASIAGRVRMILPTSSFLNAVIAIAIARISFTGSCRTHAKHDHFLAYRIHICFLSKCLWFDRLAVDRMADTVLIDLHDCGFFFLLRKCQCIIDILLSNELASF